MELPKNVLDNYIFNSNNRHAFYTQTCSIHKEILVHFDGTYSYDLLDKIRPGESDRIKKYRRDIFQSNTMSTCSKVTTELMKIRRSPDWHIDFPKDNVSSAIAEGEDLDTYLSQNYPKTTSLTNWIFSICFKQYLVDPNAVILVMPINITVPDNEYLKPFPHIFNSENIIDYKTDQYFILKSKETVSYNVDGQNRADGFIYYGVTDTHIQRYDQVAVDGKYSMVWSWEHNIGTPPVVAMFGVISEMTENNWLCHSRISPMVPHLNEALSEHSDEKAEIIQHVHSTLWTMQAQECRRCKGSGLVPKENSAPIQCNECAGKGTYPFNPYESLVVRPPNPSEPATPSPPAGYVQKDLGIAKLLDERVRAHKRDALSAIRFDHLQETPLSQSGVAKQYDGEGANNFAHAIAEDVIRIMDDIVYYTNEERYLIAVPDAKERGYQLPYIHVPEKFDMLSEQYMIANLKAMVDAKIDPTLINETQKELATKMFATNPEVAEYLSAVFDLNPFAGVGSDELIQNLTFNLIDRSDAIIAANINDFVDRAYNEFSDFNEMDKQDKIKILKGYAAEKSNVMQPTITAL